MRVVTTRGQLDALLPRGCVLVPTMGALHAGHGALVAAAAAWREKGAARPPVVVTVFVNPTQFNDPRDLARYPRTLEADVALCERCGADVVFAPSTDEVYPPGGPIEIPRLPPVATEPKLEDAFRPGHFAGVCQVVARLFELTRPVVALFGEKDWQQLKVIEAMASRHDTPRIVGVPTVREHDGLAMSSRNVFLSPDDRRRALAISRSLHEAAACKTPREAEQVMHERITGAGLQVEYAVVRDAATLMPPNDPNAAFAIGSNGRAIIAARVGSVRLIDNAPWR